jgi:D-3-phosphoglycerate dehydrogenase
MKKWKVLLTQPIHESGIKILKKEAEVDIRNFEVDEDEKVIAEAAEDVDAIITRLQKITKKVIENARKLKVIGRYGVGYDNIDVKAATEKGIPVVYTPDAPTESVAEYTIGLMIALARRIVQADKVLRNSTRQGWQVRYKYAGDVLYGKTLGLVGLGRIGALVAKLAKPFGMKILFYDIKRDPLLERILEVVYVPLPELLRQSDFISIHVPLNEETKGMIGEEEISMMKNGAYLINTARGPIVDEKALYKALKKGKLAGAALDTFCKEPPPDDFPLFQLENVIVSPHMAALTHHFFVEAAITVAEDTLKVLKSEKPRYIVNPEVYEGKIF